MCVYSITGKKNTIPFAERVAYPLANTVDSPPLAMNIGKPVRVQDLLRCYQNRFRGDS
jgi:hypothetical protein